MKLTDKEITDALRAGKIVRRKPDPLYKNREVWHGFKKARNSTEMLIVWWDSTYCEDSGIDVEDLEADDWEVMK